jgi:hypothetical protein
MLLLDPISLFSLKLPTPIHLLYILSSEKLKIQIPKTSSTKAQNFLNGKGTLNLFLLFSSSSRRICLDLIYALIWIHAINSLPHFWISSSSIQMKVSIFHFITQIRIKWPSEYRFDVLFCSKPFVDLTPQLLYSLVPTAKTDEPPPYHNPLLVFIHINPKSQRKMDGSAAFMNEWLMLHISLLKRLYKLYIRRRCVFFCCVCPVLSFYQPSLLDRHTLPSSRFLL